MSSRLTSSTVQAGSMIGSSVRTSSVLWRSVWLSSITCWLAGSRALSRRGPLSRRWVASSSSTSPAELDATVGEQDQVVADALEVGDEVRGEHDGDGVLGGELHQALQELAARERVEARDRLVEHEQLGPLGDRERQRELGALAAGERAGALRAVETEPRDPRLARARASQPGFSAAPRRRWSATDSDG